MSEEQEQDQRLDVSLNLEFTVKGHQRAVDKMEEVLRELGFYTDINVDHQEHYEGTAARFVSYLLEYMQPFDPGETLKTFKSDSKSLVGVTKIPYRQACAHHLIPAFGYAHIGYLPNGKIVGLSKLARIVKQVCTSRPSVQEVICDTICEIVDDYLDPRGTIVVIQAEHGCIACRGVAAPGIGTTTSSIRGQFRDVPSLRQEFLNLIQSPGVRQ